MIAEPNTRNAHLLSAWSAGIALLCLGVGLHGATSPLLPPSVMIQKDHAGEETVIIENFEPPASEEALPEPKTKEVDIEIPPLPEIPPPLTPPEMVEITPLDETPPPRLMPRPVEKKPAPTPTPATKPAPRPASQPPATTGNSSSDSGTAPVAFNRSGNAGRFPDPTYPVSSRSAKQQGTVRLLVTVEASGIPSFVEVAASSGFPALDSAARTTISRRWRWPSGSVRKFIIPIRFVLK